MMKKVLVVAMSFALAGCTLFRQEVPGQTDHLNIPKAWSLDSDSTEISKIIEDEVQKTGQQSPRGLELFNDPQLISLIDQALTVNSDLIQGELNLKKALLTADINEQSLFPQVSATTGASRNDSLKSPRSSSNSFSNSLNFSYELDLWGRLRAQIDASNYDAIATSQDLAATRLTVVSTAAKCYWEIGLYKQNIAAQKQIIEIYQKQLKLVQTKVKAGTASPSDLYQMEQTLISAQNQLPNLEKQLAASRRTLAVLMNQPPTYRMAEITTLPNYQALDLPLDVPVAVILNRPDVRSAYARLQSSYATTDATKLSYFPTISLTDAISTGGNAVKNWMGNPLNALSIGVSLPFLQFNTVGKQIDSAKLSQQVQEETYKKTVYTALQDVENCMQTWAAAKRTIETQQQVVELTKARAKIDEARYRAGTIDLQTLLSTQNDLISAITQQAQSQLDYLESTLALWVAQGGPQLKQNQLSESK